VKELRNRKLAARLKNDPKAGFPNTQVTNAGTKTENSQQHE
jgi:hypothetical protein